MIFIAPFFLFMAAIFLLPLLMVLFYSLGDFRFTLQFFEDFVTAGFYRQVLWTTVEISVVSTVLTLLIGYPVAYHLFKQSPRKRIMLAMLLLLPFYTSILVKSFAFTVVLGHNGIANSILRSLFGPEANVPMLYNRVGVYIALTHNLIPYMVFPILTSLLAQDRTLHRAAEMMGASRTRIFWRVTFPLSLHGVVAGSLLAVIHALGQFLTPALLGGRKELMMANMVQFHINQGMDWNTAAAISVVLLIMASLFILVLARVRGGQMFEARKM